MSKRIKRDIPLLSPEMRAKLVGQRVRVHRNLKNGLWSITHGGLVVAHTEYVKLAGATFIVSAASRARAVREKTRNVHAWAEGQLVTETQHTLYPTVVVTYNPFLETPGFVLATDGTAQVHQAGQVSFTKQRVCLASHINQLLLL